MRERRLGAILVHRRNIIKYIIRLSISHAFIICSILIPKIMLHPWVYVAKTTEYYRIIYMSSWYWYMGCTPIYNTINWYVSYIQQWEILEKNIRLSLNHNLPINKQTIIIIFFPYWVPFLCGIIHFIIFLVSGNDWNDPIPCIHSFVLFIPSMN